MDIRKQRLALDILSREVAGRVLRAAAYSRQVAHQDSLSTFALRALKDVDKRLGRILSDTAQLVLRLRTSDSPDILRECTRGLQQQIVYLGAIQQSSFSRIKHPAPAVELKRFARIISKQILYIFPPTETAAQSELSMREALTILPIDGLVDALLVPEINLRENDEADQLRDENDYETFSDYLSESRLYIHGSAVGIPRIDSTNPLRWPSLVHEMAHACCGSQHTARALIMRELQTSVGQQGASMLKEAESIIPVRDWLLECWSDLFGAVAFGPAFWRAQSVALLFGDLSRSRVASEQTAHPPNLFRLLLIWEIVCRRFPSYIRDGVAPLFEEIKLVHELLDAGHPTGGLKNPLIRQLYFSFQSYFLTHFLVLGNDEAPSASQLQQGYKEMMRHWKTSKPFTFRKITSALRDEIPVPTVPPNAKSMEEDPVYIQELLIGAWMSYAKIEKDWWSSFLNVFERNETMRSLDIQGMDKLVSSTEYKAGTKAVRLVSERYDRLDLAVLRSLQVSEWVHKLKDHIGGSDAGKPSPSMAPANKPQEDSGALCAKLSQFETSPKATGLLVDHQIFHLINSGKLRIIPLVDLATQLGTNSLDVRVGPTFEIFSPICVASHAVKPPDGPAQYYSSQIKDLDLAEYFQIMPGQFVLASTMEYFIFPDDIAAEIEGRSSFARQGLEVHRTAGFIDNAFSGTITFELYNAGPRPIPITPGERVAQLRFFRTARPFRPYSKRSSAKYGKQLTHLGSLRSIDIETKMIREFQTWRTP